MDMMARVRRADRVTSRAGAAILLGQDGERALAAFDNLSREESVMLALIAGAAIGSAITAQVGGRPDIAGTVCARLMACVREAVDARERAEAGAISV